MDPATATLLAAIVGVSGTIAAAIIGAKWKSQDKSRHHVVEYRLSFAEPIEREPWIRRRSSLARIARGFGWVAAFVLILFGTTMLFWSVAILVASDFLFPSLTQKGLIVTTMTSSGTLATIAALWIEKRIKVHASLENDEDENDE
ncbi:hypothetical protein IVA76_01875 [Bradyrhizobium sp. 135]|nr:hypothetical protein [Bradyrhizobium sp. 135]